MPRTLNVLPPEKGVCLITLQRPEALNALSTELLGELAQALEIAEREPEVRVVVLTGSRKAFARQAQRVGLVSEITQPDLTVERALEIGRLIATKAPLAVRLAKEVPLKAQDVDLASGLNIERQAFVMLAGTADRNEGLRAFQEKRPPRFVGR